MFKILYHNEQTHDDRVTIQLGHDKRIKMGKILGKQSSHDYETTVS